MPKVGELARMGQFCGFRPLPLLVLADPPADACPAVPVTVGTPVSVVHVELVAVVAPGLGRVNRREAGAPQGVDPGGDRLQVPGRTACPRGAAPGPDVID